MDAMSATGAIDIKAFAAAHFLRSPTADFNDIQADLTVSLGRNPVRAERRILTEAFRENFNQRAAALRAEEDRIYASSHSGKARSGFLVITAYSRNYKIGPLCANVNRRYCEAHGYQWQEDVLGDSDMMAAISPRRSASWYKILMINRLLERELGNPDDVEGESAGSATGVRYILWIDADASIIDHSLTLEQIVAEGEHRDLLIGEDMHACSGSYINAGVFLLRVGHFAQRFFTDVWAREAEEKARAEWNDDSYDHNQYQHQIGQRRHYFFVRQFEQSAMQKVLRYQQQGLEFCYYQPGCTRGPGSGGSGGSGVGANVFLSAASGCDPTSTATANTTATATARLHAFHTFSPENAHLPLDSPLLGRKHFPNVCVFPSWEFNSCLRASGTLADDEEEEEEEGDGGREGVAKAEEAEGEEVEEGEEGGQEGGERESKARGQSSSPRRPDSAGVHAGAGAAKPIQMHRMQRGARFIYHPAGKKDKFGLMSQVLADRGLLL